MKIRIMAMAGLFALLGCGSADSDLRTVANVDVERYMGKWFDIANFPQRFQKDCKCTSAEYKLLADKTVEVFNRCIDSKTGEVKDITGKAFVADKTTNAKLKVQFFWPFKGDYWIVELADDYSYAVVSEPGKEYLWILSRTPQMDNQVYEGIVSRLKEKGFDISKIVRTVHDDC